MKNNKTEENLNTEIAPNEMLNIENKEAELLSYEEASVQLGEIYNNFLSKTIVRLIPILTNGSVSKSRYIEAPLFVSYLGIEGARKDYFNALWSETRGYVSFQPLTTIVEGDNIMTMKVDYYEKNEAGYRTFFWNDAEKIKDSARVLYNEQSAEMSIIAGEFANGMLSKRLEELKSSFTKKLGEIKVVFHYDEGKLLSKPV